MSTTLQTVLISGASEDLTARIEQLIRGQAELSLTQSVTPDAAANESFKAKLIWIELESDPEGNVVLLEQLIKSHPNTFFVVSKEDLEPELVKKAMQVGALDFLDHKGWAAQIRSVVRRIMAKEFGSKPAAGSPMTAASRQPAGGKPSSWNQLNSLKVSVPSSSGFRRVEPSKPAAPAAPPAAAAKPAAPAAPAAPPKPAAPPPPAKPAAPPEPPPAPEPEEVEEPIEDTTGEIEQVAEEEVPYEEAAEQGLEEEQPAYAEESDEAAYAAESEAYSEQEGEVAYAEGEGEYAEQQGEYVEQEGEPWAEQGGEVEGEAYAEPVDDSQAEAFSEEEEELPVEELPEEAQEEIQEETPEEPEATNEDEQPASDSEDEAPAVPATPTPAAPKGRWDELDSIISTSKPADEKKSKWGDLDSIQTKKDLSTSQPLAKTPNKWGDLDSIGTAAKDTPAEKEPTSKANKWGDLDSIGSKSESKDAPAAKAGGSKWGDLDALGGKSAAAKDTPAAPATGNKWGDLDAIGDKSAAKDSAEPAGSKWGDLDSIGSTPKSFKKDEPAAGGSKWGDLDAIPGSKAESAGAESGGANKWGNLDGLGSKSGGGGMKSNTRSFIKPKAPDESAPAASAPAPAGGKSKWGDLDSIGSGGGTTGGADAAAGADGSKWGGDLNAIPTPKSGQEASGPQQWGSLDSIPTPKGENKPALVEGALPVSQISNEASQKWKAGMSSDMSTGARQVGEMRDKLKGKKVGVKIGWDNVNILLAVAIVAAVGFLGVQFFTYPEVTNEQASK